MHTDQDPVVRFGPFELRLCTGELRKNGHKIRLQEHSCRILSLLVAHPGDVVTREELRNALWADGTVVDYDNGLNAAMGKLRQAMADSADQPRYIETIPRKGYRFIGTLEAPEEQAPVRDAAPELPPAASVLSRPRWFVPVGVAVAALVALILASRGITGARPGVSPPTGKQMLVVLPFVNLAGDPEQEFFADGLTEEMTSQLSGLEPKGLGVIARTSAMQYKNGAKSVAQIGRELAVDYVLEGSVRRNADRVRITAQLIRARDQVHLWAANYDRPVEDVLTLQSEIGRAVAERISLTLSAGADARLDRAKVTNPRAYDACQRGRYFLWRDNGQPTDLDKAATYFRQAIAADPRYAAAYSGLAETYSAAAQERGQSQENIRESQKYAAKAVELDANLAEARVVLAFAAAHHDRDWNYARQQFLRALELDPSYTRARTLYCVYLLAIGEPQEAVNEIRRAQALDPLAWGVREQVVRTLYLARSYGEAITESQKSLELNPHSRSTTVFLAEAYAEVGRFQEAMQLFDRMESQFPEGPTWLAARGHLMGLVGRPAEARKTLDRLQELGKQGFTVSYMMAVVCAGLHENQAALGWLERAYQLNDSYFNLRVKTDPALDALRSEPRLQDLLRRMKYPS